VRTVSDLARFPQGLLSKTLISLFLLILRAV
jgi:hypothetical protein